MTRNLLSRWPIRKAPWILEFGIGFILLYATHTLPLRKVSVQWQMEEVYTNGRIPSGAVVQEHCVRTPAGLRVGADEPGWLEYRFGPSGPTPTAFKTEWLPDLSAPSRIVVRQPDGPFTHEIVLSRRLPMHIGAFDVSRYVDRKKPYSIRFEGRNALLKSMWVYQVEAPLISAWPFWLIGLLLLWRRRENPYKAGLVVILLIGFGLRWREFLNFFSVPLQSDAIEYRVLAQSLSWAHPFQTGPREPFFIWLVRVATAMIGPADQTSRLLTLLISCGCIGMVFKLALDLGWSRRAALIAAALYGMNPFAIFMSVQGLQLEVFTLLILIFIDLCWRGSLWGIGLVGVALTVLRVQSFFSIIPLALLAGWIWRRDNKGNVLIAIGIILLGVLPYFISVKNYTGSWMGHLNMHAQFYSRAPVSIWQYLFGAQSVFVLIAKSVSGYTSIFLNPQDPYNHLFLNSHYARSWNWLWLPFFWWGIWLCVRRSAGRWLLMSVGIFLNALPFMRDIIQDPRLLFHVAPLISLITAIGLDSGVEWVEGRYRPKLFQAR
jgi:hypothetical protein